MGECRIAYATGTRADYGIVRHYLEKLNQDEDIDLEILVTGALLSKEYGHQVDLIVNDKFVIGAKIELPIDTTSNAGIPHVMSVALDKFDSLFEAQKYDLLILLGDRYEILSVALAASMQKIPILHLHGGEATFANYDEFIRHSITKMSRFHITATQEYRHRVIQLGENPKNVYHLGALGAENCMDIDESQVPDMIKDLQPKSYAVVLFHPETLSNINPFYQIQELLKALDHNRNIRYVFLGANADTYSHEIRQAVKQYVEKYKEDLYYENLHTDAYHYLVKNSAFLIGNSSSGIIEAPSLGVRTINIGDRQKGRVRGNSVMDVACSAPLISKSIRMCLKNKIESITNPYYQKDSCNQYYLITKQFLEDSVSFNFIPKIFYDINF